MKEKAVKYNEDVVMGLGVICLIKRKQVALNCCNKELSFMFFKELYELSTTCHELQPFPNSLSPWNFRLY